MRNTLAIKQHYDFVLDLQSGLTTSLAEFLGDRLYDEVIEKARVAVEHEYLNGKNRYVCLFCRKPMSIRSKWTADKTEQRFHFQHRFTADATACDGSKKLTEEQVCAKKYDGAKESARHILAKRMIENSVLADDAFDKDATKQEGRWTSKDGVSWRRPDVQSKWKGKRVAFEVQLSTTFLHIIAQRQKFYRDDDGLLLWLFGDLDIEALRLAEEDIYFSNNHNAFKVSQETVALSQESGRLALECVWDVPVIGEHGIAEAATIPESRIVYFDELTFDVSSIGVPRAYYFDYEGTKEALEHQRRKDVREARDRPLKDAMEAFALAYNDSGDIQDSWLEIRQRFAARGFNLPEYFSYSQPVFHLLKAAYSSRHGTPVLIGQNNLREVANNLFTNYKFALWVFSVMMGHYDRFEEMQYQDASKKTSWLKKVREFKQGWLTRDPQYLPNHDYDDLLAFLFPEAEAMLRRDASEVMAERAFERA